MNVHSQEMEPKQTAAAILDAALGLFSERGFHGTSVPSIAKAAGLAAGTMYRHFASKEALVNALYRREKRALMAALLDAFPFGAPAREQFRAFWFRLAAFARENPKSFEFLELHHHAAYLDPQSLRLERDSLLAFRQFLTDEGARGVIKPASPEVLMALVWGAFSMLFKAHRLGHLELREELVAQAEACAWDAIRA